ncbi:acetoacetate--CoA ligase [Ornithinicoccus halotolerans]|uniref:acetoacetate--CoA ligase n=1 Tax=Ornithinicoccus halotolerans TaxID=1748220 RepID=UPI001297DC33|nr:acetoacetate--CoA ligase [Ornithinicoccus halotolerans]
MTTPTPSTSTAAEPGDGEILWRPSPEQVEQAAITAFARRLGTEPLPYDTLHRLSVADPGRFWDTFWDFAGIVGDRGSGPAIDWPATGESGAGDSGAGDRMTGARFFPGARLNVAENLLVGEPDALAAVEADEHGEQARVTVAELRARVAAAQAGLESLGVGPGDRVAALLPNDLDSLVCLLAATSLGAVWSSCAPEFGDAGVLDRFGQIDPTLLVVADDYLYNGRRHDLADKGLRVAAQLPTLRHIVLTGEGPVPEGPRPVHRLGELADDSRTTPRFPRFAFDHPLYIVYTSGTTGRPKCILHQAGGTLLTVRKEHLLHCDLRPGDRMLYYTNTAWMMYHWLVAARASGAAVVLYDGAALPRVAGGPDSGALWRVAERAGATHFGTSPKYLSLLEEQGYRPGQEHDLGPLRMVLSAGAPLRPANFRWTYREVKADLCLASISGGTEILGCFVMGNPTLPVRCGEIQGPALGMAVHVLDERQAPVHGREGELVCTEPFPSMPLRFWGPEGRQRYLDSYFAARPGIWSHGDLARTTPSGGVVISGRADSVLKPGGVRIGAGEVYAVVEQLPGVSDSIVVGVPVEDDVQVWLFVVPAPGRDLDDGLREEVRAALRQDASPRHVPAQVLQVAEVPYTLSGKRMERAALQAATAQPVSNLGSVANPTALDAIGQAAAAVPGGQRPSVTAVSA